MSRLQTLPALLAAVPDGHQIAFFDRDRAVSYAGLADESERLAAALRELGVGAGDRVGVWLPNVTAWLSAFFACARLGAIAVAVNTRFRSAELADIVGRSGLKVLFVWPAFEKADFVGVLAGCPPASLAALSTVVAYDENEDSQGQRMAALAAALPAHVGLHRYAACLERAPLADNLAAPAAGCAIFTTSGTTKAPKFVLHDQRTLVAHAFDVVTAWGLDAHSSMLLAPPLCGVFGVANAMAMLAAQRPFAMMPVWDAVLAAELIERHQATHMNATDEAVAQLLALNERTPAYPTLRFVGYAAFNPAMADMVERAQARGLTLLGLYGISEIQALFSRQSEHAPLEERRLGGGVPVSPLARVRARDPDTGQLLAHGGAGELEFLAPSSRMVEYFGNPQATAEALLDGGWYRSGDLGYTREDGGFVFLTRMGDSLRLGGFLVSPAEIEECAQQFDGIDGCQVVGVTTGGALRPVAFVTLKAGARLDEAALTAHIASRLARYKVPVRTFAIDAFPVTEGTNATKIQKHRLRDLAQQRLDASPV
ncbi:MAG TPA: AMP-binding protein [Burkholderiaceae bacterium]|jgi:fatty-acyl-CoA synthase|nr:AMP-binding protein [Burkholderiaceae bacterium]